MPFPVALLLKFSPSPEFVEARAKMTTFQVHKSWLIPSVLVLVVVGLADSAAAWLAPNPLLWCTLISALFPILWFVFVLLPILRQRSSKS
jgi:hypothetical protein